MKAEAVIQGNQSYVKANIYTVKCVNVAQTYSTS